MVSLKFRVQIFLKGDVSVVEIAFSEMRTFVILTILYTI